MIHYINKYTETPEKHKEVRWITLNWPLIISVSFAMFILISAMIIGGIYGIINNNTLLSVYSFVVAAIFIVSGAILPNTIFQHLRMPKKYLDITSEFLDNKVQISASNGKTRTFSYENIYKIKETDNYFVIIFKETEDSKSYLSIKKDSFTRGDSTTFLSFLSA